MRINDVDGQVSLFGADSACGRMSSAPTPADRPRAATSEKSSRRSFGLKNHRLMLLDLRPGAGNMLGFYWEYDPVWLGPPGTLNTSESPRPAVGSSLSRIMQASVPLKYYLSRRACLGILRRENKRGKPLPEELKTALTIQAGVGERPMGSMPRPSLAFHINQGEETIDLGDVSGTLPATPNIQMQPFISQPTFAAGFNAGAGASAGGIGYSAERAPTLKAGQSGNMTPSVLCLNDQGGQIMHCTKETAGTLRAQARGHQPLVFENHGIDARYTGPLSTVPTLSARAGTGGNNTALIADLYARKRTNDFQESDTASTQGARQYKDATDLILQKTDAPVCFLIRRLTPLECERLQGFPDGWTDLPGASDSARYRALGNSVAIPCVERLLLGIVRAVREGW